MIRKPLQPLVERQEFSSSYPLALLIVRVRQWEGSRVFQFELAWPAVPVHHHSKRSRQAKPIGLEFT